jgi:hypothetical protein
VQYPKNGLTSKLPSLISPSDRAGKLHTDNKIKIIIKKIFFIVSSLKVINKIEPEKQHVNDTGSSLKKTPRQR